MRTTVFCCYDSPFPIRLARSLCGSLPGVASKTARHRWQPYGESCTKRPVLLSMSTRLRSGAKRLSPPGHASGHDGVVNDYFLVRTASFTPRGAMSDEELAAEHVTGWRWWSLPEIREYVGPELFSPRDLATPLAALIADGVPTQPVPLAL